jgi:hypothetical protein
MLNLKYNSMTSGLSTDYYESTDSSSKTYKRLSQIGYLAGAVCVVGGAVIYYAGWRLGRVVLIPAVGSNSAAALVAGAF